MADRVVPQIEVGIRQIDQLFEAYADLFERLQCESPDLVEITAVGSVLHSFYNGLENIFLSIAKEVDLDVPTGGHWHRDLLARMAESIPNRAPVLSYQLVQELADYLGFRHFYRHSYSFYLDWDELEKLVMPVTEVWERTKGELWEFIETLSAGGRATATK